MKNILVMERDKLRDDQWQRIEQMLPGKVTDPGRSAADNRLFMEAVLWILRTGAPWRDLPQSFGPWNSVYQRFRRWSERGVWFNVFRELAKDADFEERRCAPVRSTSGWQYRAGSSARCWRGQKNGAQAIGRSRGGLTTKIHAAVEGLGNLVDFILTGGNVHDSTQAEELLDRIEAHATKVDAQIASVTADKGYDAKAIVARVEDLGALRAGAAHPAVIPQLCNRKDPRPVDWAQYKNRNLVERFFARLKQFRRIATRYDKLVARFASFLHLAAAYVWLA
jgi:transposase